MFFKPYAQNKGLERVQKVCQDGLFMLTSPSQQESEVQIPFTMKWKKFKISITS